MKFIVFAIGCGAALAIAHSAIAHSAIAQQQPASAAPASEPAAGATATQRSDVLVIGHPLAPEAQPASAKNWLDHYLPYEQRVSGWVDNTARSIDRFFGTDDAWRVDNESWLRITNDMRWEEGDGIDHELRPRLKLDLPTASKRLRLLIESDAPEERTAAEETVPGLRTGEERRRTVFGVGTHFEKWLPNWKTQLQGGVRVRLPVDPYVRFIARRDIPLGGDWELNSYNRFAWFNSDGYSAKSEIKVGKPLAPDWRLYYATNFSWREERDYLQFAQSANLANVLTPSSAITYTAGYSGRSFADPEIEKYFLTADYRRNIARRIVFLDVIPELNFADEHDFDPRWAITVRLELYFQKRIDVDD